MKHALILAITVLLTACGGGDLGSYDKYFFEYHKSNSSYAVYGPYPSLADCATARSRFPSYNTTGCHL